MKHRAAVFLITLFVSAIVLLLQLVQTRILSVMLWHHFVYITITMALLGFADEHSMGVGDQRFRVGHRFRSGRTARDAFRIQFCDPARGSVLYRGRVQRPAVSEERPPPSD